MFTALRDNQLNSVEKVSKCGADHDWPYRGRVALNCDKNGVRDFTMPGAGAKVPLTGHSGIFCHNNYGTLGITLNSSV